MPWRAFFEGDHSLYVNDRHRLLHDALIAKGVAAHITTPNAAVLDYGCGEARAAATIAAKCATLYLFDAARNVQLNLRHRFAGEAKICILDETGFAALAPASLDMIVIVSVLQYVAEAEFSRWLGEFALRLKPGGKLVIGDVIPKNLSAAEDARALLDFGWRGGFLGAAVLGLARTAVSDYRTLRAQLGLTTYDEAEMIALLRTHDFEAARATENIGHNQKRMTFVAHKYKLP